MSGNVTVNGITDEDLVKILQVKIKYEKSLYFSPQQMQVQQNPQTQKQTYNNASFGWNDDKGLEAVHQIILILLKQDERDEKVPGVAGR